MRLKRKSIFGEKKSSTNNSPLNKEEVDSYQHVDFYYTNIINSIILYTYDSVKLNEMTPILIDPLTELYEELEYAFTEDCFNPVFEVGLIDASFKNELLEFKANIDTIPCEIWDYAFLDKHKTWISTRQNANYLLDKLGVTTRTYNDNYTTIYDNNGNIIYKG